MRLSIELETSERSGKTLCNLTLHVTIAQTNTSEDVCVLALFVFTNFEGKPRMLDVERNANDCIRGEAKRDDK